MSKRKRHDSLSSKLPSTQSNNDYDVLTQEVVADDENEASTEESDLRNRKLLKSSTLESINVISNENVNYVNSPISNDDADNKNDNSILRRKSNRILRLKRLIVPGLQNGVGSPHSPTQIDDNNIGPQECGNSAVSSEPVSNNSTITSSTTETLAKTAANQSTSELFISSNNISNANGPSSISTNVPAKVLRKMQAWTEDDTRWFFEALCEHGKDFPHIQAYIATRCEKKGMAPDMIKNYEQVRHYYYRMWHKISQMLNISNVVEKGVQEIYGLINYGEIWKKFGSKFDSKLSANLQQLVDYGFTVFKVKGKSVRVRTPICNALKRIHNINKTTNKPTTPIPKDITIELLPATNADWIHVHSLSQNPRLRTQLTMQHRLSALIEYLERRWSLARLKENASRSLFNENLLEEDEEDNQVESSRNGAFMIRLKPQNSEKLREQVQLKSTSNSISGISYRSTTHGNAQIDLSLSSYLNLFNKNDALNEGKKAKMRKSTKKASSTESSNSLTEDKSPTDDQSNAVSSKGDSQSIDLLRMLDSMNEELEGARNKTHLMEKSNNNCDPNLSDINNDIDEKGDASPNDTDESNPNTHNHLPVPPAHTTLAEWLAGMHSLMDDKEDDIINDEEPEDKTDGNAMSSASNLNGSKSKNRRGSYDNVVVNLLTAKQARLGWTLEEAQSVTIGELYLLFCCPNKIVLEYSWVERNACPSIEETIPSSAQNETPTEETHENASSLSLLQKLIIAANITLLNIKKPNGTLTNSQPSTAANFAASNPGQQLIKPVRKRATKSTSSQLLSNVIQETILDENDNQSSSVSSNSDLEANNKTSSSGSSSETASTADCSEKDQFVAPKLPAPRANTTQGSKVSKYRTTPILDDPSKVEEVLNELKANKYRRQKRPLPKPYNLYNLQKNKMLNSNNLVNGTHSALLLIPASHLTKGQNTNQILLSDLLNSHLPQGSISLSPATTSSMTMASISQSQQQQSSLGTAPPSVVIPIQVETKQQQVPSVTLSDSLHQSSNTIISTSSLSVIESTTASNITTNFAEMNLTSTKTFSPNNSASILSDNSVKSAEQQQNASCSSKSADSAAPTTADVLTHSQLSWLNDHNDFSLGSLIAACDIVTNDELNPKISEPSMTITTEIDTHVRSMVNDNSVDLMSKFADLAAEITSSDSNRVSKI